MTDVGVVAEETAALIVERLIGSRASASTIASAVKSAGK